MKRKSTGKISVLALIGLMTLAACRSKPHTAAPPAAAHEPGTETIIDSSLAPLLQPVNRQAVSSIPTLHPDNRLRIVNMTVPGVIGYDARRQTNIASRVSGRIERLLVKYNYQPVKKGQLIMELYSPDLAAAQQELLFIYQNDPGGNMLEKAKQRLALLGMQESQIRRAIQTGKILYRIPVYSHTDGYILEKDESSFPREGQYINAGQSLFTVYATKDLVAEFSLPPAIAAEMQKGQPLVMYKTEDTQISFSGSIGLIQPAFRGGDNFTVARVYFKDDRFQAGELVTAVIPVVHKGWWVPQSAALNLGDKSIVFKKEQNTFIARPVRAKLRAEGMALIEDDIEGWEIAGNAAFLVDSESFIKMSPDQ